MALVLSGPDGGETLGRDHVSSSRGRGDGHADHGGHPGDWLAWQYWTVLIAPFYPPLVATVMLTISSVAGAWGAYLLAARVGERWQPKGLTLKVMDTLKARSDLLTQCAMRVLPGFPHSVINFAAGLGHIALGRYLLAAALGLAVKWAVYSSAIYGALEAIEEEDPLQMDVLLPLLALTALLLAGAWYRRRLEAAQEQA